MDLGKKRIGEGKWPVLLEPILLDYRKGGGVKSLERTGRGSWKAKGEGRYCGDREGKLTQETTRPKAALKKRGTKKIVVWTENRPLEKQKSSKGSTTKITGDRRLDLCNCSLQSVKAIQGGGGNES